MKKSYSQPKEIKFVYQKFCQTAKKYDATIHMLKINKLSTSVHMLMLYL